jgi:hypothetical protein
VYATDRANFYVARTVRLPLPVVTDSAARLRSGNDPVRALGLPAGGRVQVELPFRRDQWHPVGRPDLAPARAYGALYGRSNRRLCPVEVELSPWSSTVTELSVRPAVRAPYRWSDRRIGRWFAQAHDAADTLREELLVQSVGVAVGTELDAVAV